MGKCNTKVEEWTVFGERLNAELKRQNMSYREFARKAGITLGTVCRYAKSERVPRANEILKTSTALGVTCDYLLGLSDDPHKTSKGRWGRMTNLEYIRTCSTAELVGLLCMELKTDCSRCVAREYCYNGHTGFIDWLDEERGEGE